MHCALWYKGDSVVTKTIFVHIFIDIFLDIPYEFIEKDEIKIECFFIIDVIECLRLYCIVMYKNNIAPSKNPILMLYLDMHIHNKYEFY